MHTYCVPTITGADAGLDRWGFVRLARQGRARPRGVWGHAPPETFWISDLLRSLLVQSGDEIHGRRTCHASSAWWRTELCKLFPVRKFHVLYTPINNYTNGPSQGPSTCASASQRRLSSPLSYSQVSALPSIIIGTVGSKGGSSAPNEPPLDPPLYYVVYTHPERDQCYNESRQSVPDASSGPGQ